MATRKMASRIRAAANKRAGQRKTAPRRLGKKKVQAIPRGYHAVTAHLVVRGGERAIDFYKNAFGAKEKARIPGPNGKLMHAEIQIGDSIVMLQDEDPERGSKSPQTLGGPSSSLLIYTRDVDALFERAVAAGATVQMPVSNMFWGDRYAKVLDPFGHEWQLATHVEDVPPKEMAKRAAAVMSGPPPQGAQE
jgi:PhnB protein